MDEELVQEAPKPVSGGLVIFLCGPKAILLAFPAAALVALVYGFPIPFGGKESGPDAMVRAMFAAMFFVVFGGFIVLGVFGMVAGCFAVELGGKDRRKVQILSWLFPFLVALACAVFIATLDLFIGQW